MKFCKLEKDQKSFDYIKKYLQASEKNKIETLLELDNELQDSEIILHCNQLGICSDCVNTEALNWITNWGSTFRSYLSTLKLLFIVLKYSNIQTKDLTWEKFCNAVDEVNKLQCLFF